MHRIARAALGTLLAATLTLSASATATAAPPHRDVDPAALPVGAKPAMPYLDWKAEKIHLPGGHTVSTKPLRTDGYHYAGELLHARGGWLLPEASRMHGKEATTVRFVGESGRVHGVVRRATYDPQVVSADGRWYVDREYAGSRLRAVRVADGHVIASHDFSSPTFDPTVLAVGDGRVLVRTVSRSHGRFNVTTSSWTTRTGAVRVLSRQRGLPMVTAGVGSTAAHLYSVPRGTARGGSAMLDSRTQRRLWTVKGESVASFSPDDRRVVTTGFVGYDEDAPWEMTARLRVRDARTGRLQATFTGDFGAGYRSYQPIWETPTSLLLHATGDPTYDPGSESFTYPDPSIVRCSVVTARCQRVSVDQHYVQLQVRKSN